MVEKKPPEILTEDDIRDSPSDSTGTNQQLEKLSLPDQMKLKDQKHEHDRDDRITNWGFVLVCVVIALCFIVSLAGSIIGEVGLFREFFTIAATTVSLILGYLFGNRKSK